MTTKLLKGAHLQSEKAKAQLQNSIAQDDAKIALQENSPIQTREAIKGFWAQYPKAKILFGKVIVKWRGSSATRPTIPGFWAAYPYRDWVKAADLPQRTMQRYLDLLENHGLIERTHGKHGGTRQLAFIRPTALVLKLSDHRPNDWLHLQGKKSKEKPTDPKPSVLTAPVTQLEEDKPATIEEILAIINDEVDID